MPQRGPTFTEAEVRARRLRRTYLSLFAVFLCAALFISAYAGFLAIRSRAPARFVPTQPPSGELSFSIDVANQALGIFPGAELGDSRGAAQYRVLRSALAPRGQWCVWEGEPEQWVAFLPIVRPQRFYLDRIKGALQSTRSLTPMDSQPSDRESATIYYEVLPQGVILSSTNELPPYQLLTTPSDGETSRAIVYRSGEGFLPARYGNFSLQREPVLIEWQYDPIQKTYKAVISQSQRPVAEVTQLDPFLGYGKK